VPLAEGTITVEAGQARLSGVTVRAQRADLAVNGGINLIDGALDARLTLFGASSAGAPANTRPEILIMLKGSLDAPKRSTDVAALASWLALRAVEQQAKKLDVLEGREPAAAAARPAIKLQSVPAPSAVPGTVPSAVAREPTTPGAAQSEPAASAPNPALPPQPTTSAPKPKPAAPAAERAPSLPPPIDIRPAPAPHAPRTQQGAQAAPGQGQQQKPPTAPVPPRPRSLSEILFGR
jgi:hypothetical protein